MTNKVLLQIISGVLLIISFFNNWLYNGGFTYVKPMELVNAPSSQYSIKMLLVLPILGVILIYFGYQRVYSKKAVLSSLVLTVIPAYNFYKGVTMNNNLGMKLQIEVGYVMCLIALGTLLISCFVQEKRVHFNHNEKDTSD